MNRRRVPCPNCGKKFPTETRMLAHKADKHKGVPVPVQPPSGTGSAAPSAIILGAVFLLGVFFGALGTYTVQRTDIARTALEWIKDQAW